MGMKNEDMVSWGLFWCPRFVETLGCLSSDSRQPCNPLTLNGRSFLMPEGPAPSFAS